MEVTHCIGLGLLALLLFNSVLTLRAVQKHHDQVMRELRKQRERGGQRRSGHVAPRQ